MRTSNPILGDDIQEVIDSGKEIRVLDRGFNRRMYVRSLKRVNRVAYDAALVEIEIEGHKVRVDKGDLMKALAYT